MISVVIFRFGSNSVYLVSLSIRRPRNLPTPCQVVPTPIAPSEVFVVSLMPDAHLGFFEESLITAKTSSIGRLTVVLTSALTKG